MKDLKEEIHNTLSENLSKLDVSLADVTELLVALCKQHEEDRLELIKQAIANFISHRGWAHTITGEIMQAITQVINPQPVILKRGLYAVSRKNHPGSRVWFMEVDIPTMLDPDCEALPVKNPFEQQSS